MGGCGHISSFRTSSCSSRSAPRKFGVNIYGGARIALDFDLIANLFIPSTVDACYLHDGSGPAPGIKSRRMSGVRPATMIGLSA